MVRVSASSVRWARVTIGTRVAWAFRRNAARLIGPSSGPHLWVLSVWTRRMTLG